MFVEFENYFCGDIIMAIDTGTTNATTVMGVTKSSLLTSAALNNAASSAVANNAEAANQMFVGMLKQLGQNSDMLGQSSLSSRGMAHDVDCTNREVHGGFGGKNAESTKSVKKENKSESVDKADEKDTSYKDEKVEKTVNSKGDSGESQTDEDTNSNEQDDSENVVSKATAEEEELLMVLYGAEGVNGNAGNNSVVEDEGSFYSGEQAKSAEAVANSSQSNKGTANAAANSDGMEQSAQVDGVVVKGADDLATTGEDSITDDELAMLKNKVTETQGKENSKATPVSSVVRQQAETIANKIGDNDNLSVKVSVENSGDKSVLQNSASNAALSAAIAEDAAQGTSRFDAPSTETEATPSGSQNNTGTTIPLAFAGQNLSNGGHSTANQQNQNSANYMAGGVAGNAGNTAGTTSGETVQTTTMNGVAIKGTSTQIASVTNSAASGAGASSSAANANVAAGSGLLGSSSVATTQQSSDASGLTGKTTFGGELAEKMNSQQAVDQVKVNITKAFGSGNDKIQIQLRPANLGKVDVSLEISSEGKLKAIVKSSEKSTHEILQRDAASLGQALKDAGLKADADSIEFQYKGGAEEQNNYADNNGDNVGDGQGNQDGQNLKEEKFANGAIQSDEIEENNWGPIDIEDYNNFEAGRLNIQV
jgi:hypothetical protein